MDHRRGRKSRLRLNVKRKKCNFKCKAKHWSPKTQLTSTTAIRAEGPATTLQITPTRETNVTPQDSYQQPLQHNDSKDTTPPSEFPLTFETQNTETELDLDTDAFRHLKGRRIVDIKYLFNAIKKIKHVGFDCNFGHLEFKKEIRRGLLSEFIFTCPMCQQKKSIFSESPSKKVNINLALVKGMVCTGNGFSQLDEICGAANIPCMTKNTFYKIEKDVQSTFEQCALEEMVEAGEEKRLAIIDNEVEIDPLL